MQGSPVVKSGPRYPKVAVGGVGRVFVANVPPVVTPEALADLFSRCGSVMDVVLEPHFKLRCVAPTGFCNLIGPF